MTARTLVLLRHAKADDPPGLKDIDRPLVMRGRLDAKAAGAWLATRGLLPDLVLCSAARRTRETWHGVALGLAEAGAESGPEVRYERQLYSGDVDDLLDVVRVADEDAATILVIGHNPTVSDASVRLAPDEAAEAFTGLQTAALAVHRCTGPWTTLGPATAELVERHTARH
ncbi:SixA phosphatase family protein [Spirilliplanes yamanashiensis]|uniref:Phosphohistidine phosphatase n=1 Tax=Spirilliplanes yamanashiensis TaxID=42233 RepID=A0A8J3Y7H7_9ACTN|nr:histidine phosphatase family protein [Spirilliplanes yamanashiensis]MDP9815052.1 phosphohistidine phosphatase [Spirilliplanes yamanashiensis]GIJ02708.1 phosphohistidine phosphatase [Spirilliplanes yamanashiensis]